MNGLCAKKETIRETDALQEFRFELYNQTDRPVWLGDVVLFHADSLAELGVREEGCRLFRSGRHKNDMPTVAQFGVMDGAMLDALGGMTESGERSGRKTGRTIVSDNLTVLGTEAGYVMLAFMTGCDQLFSTEIEIDEMGRFVSLTAKVHFDVFIDPGQRVKTETLRIERTKDAEESIRRFAKEKAEMYRARASVPPSVFCTWYYYGLTVTQEDVLGNLEQMAAMKLPFDVFQIDEGWEKTLGWYEPNEKFPLPMQELARRIREAGYRPGIWTSPFVAKETAPVWQEHPEWILRDKAGAPCIFPMNDTTYWVFDITHPGTRAYFTELYRKLTFDWGYTYHKLDFTRAAVIYPDADFFDKRITLARAYREAVAAIREGMGEEAYFLMCGGLYDPIIGLVDAQRSGSDVLSMWSSTINKGGKTAPYTIKQSTLRTYMNAWWHNDPDALMVRRNENMERGLRLTYGLLSDDEVRTVTINQLIGGGIVCSTEPLDRIDTDRLHVLRHILPPMHTQIQPLDLMQSERFPARVRVGFEAGDRVLIAQINWSDTQSERAAITLDRQTLGDLYAPDARYAVCDFYAGEYETSVCAGSSLTLGEIPPHSAALIKVERMAGQPMIVASDGHFSMGLELERLSAQDGCLHVTAQQRFERSTAYQALIPQTGEIVSFVLCGQGRHELRIPMKA